MKRRGKGHAGRAGSSRGRMRVGVIFGGRSVEHEVSLVSARAIMQALDPRRYEVVPIGITRQGRWVLGDFHCALPPDPSVGGLVRLRNGGREVGLASFSRSPLGEAHAGGRARRAGPGRLDVVFPIVHGTGGEDGTLQGLLDLADIPYVGAGVLGSAVGMDKAMMKVIFRDAGLPIVDHRVIRSRELATGRDRFVHAVEESFGYPCFVKPANGGSSVGVSKARDRGQLLTALDVAARYDRKVIVERAVDGREIECSVLGNDEPEASVPGEIIPANEFYDYRAKYIDENSRLLIPAPLTNEQTQRVRDLAVKAFKALDLCGMARADFFLDRASEAIFINELNTIPGFTPISMYPKLWEASGLPFPALVDRLIRLALERHAEKKSLVTTYRPTSNGRRTLTKG
ncbi:MAG TPA: D-alanine--D-alanine ligase family protein [Candidatus Polarisedimenticolia bacterium]|nr:D-alanine--D-alanine ligase family protein [Candidatus Polarisedimenticolia bacterium]